jgi:hypothetical protein
MEVAYLVQGRWTLKPELMPESALPPAFRLARCFVIVVFAKGKVIPYSDVNWFCDVFGLGDKESFKLVLSELGVGVPVAGDKVVTFRWKTNDRFGAAFPEWEEKANKEIAKLKETVCNAKGNPTIFDKFIKQI